jgi:hypothetical protein
LPAAGRRSAGSSPTAASSTSAGTPSDWPTTGAGHSAYRRAHGIDHKDWRFLSGDQTAIDGLLEDLG